MHFRVEHHYEGISLAEYESLHFDEPFNVALCEVRVSPITFCFQSVLRVYLGCHMKLVLILKFDGLHLFDFHCHSALSFFQSL